MRTDPFSEVLRLLEATSVVSGGFTAGGAWSLRIPPPGQLVFSAIAKGSCWLQLSGQKRAVRLNEGDVGLLSGRHGFVLASNPSVPPVDLELSTENWGMGTVGEGGECVVLAGRVSLEPSNASFLTDVLPERILVRASSPRAASLRWILDELLDESGSSVPGGNIVSAQLAQLLFVQILRAHLTGSGALPGGWLRAMRDPRLVRAMQLIHAEPARAWRLADLAREAGMSRTRFAVHFGEVVGVAPLAYLAEWRMRLAQKRLREEDASVLDLAQSLGYASESAFSHAFKRITGVSPREYRSASRGSDPSPT